MQKVILLSILVWMDTAHSWNLQNDVFQQIPGWMETTIQEQLDPFTPQQLSSPAIEETLSEIALTQGSEVAKIVRVISSATSVDWIAHWELDPLSTQRIHSFLEALKTLGQITPLPHFDLLLSLADRFDRPVFLRAGAAPVFTVSKARANQKAVLIPRGLWNSEREEQLMAIADSADQIPWEDKIPLAFWRGSLTEGVYPYFDWDFKPRAQLVLSARHFPELLDAGFIDNRYFQEMHYTWQMWMRDNQCLRDHKEPQEQVEYRYLIAIDGKASPGSLEWQLFSRSTILKADSDQTEWFYKGLEPYKHYIPFRNDSADLTQQVVWIGEHPEEAEKVAREARAFAESHLVDYKMFLYFYKLLSAYAQRQKESHTIGKSSP